jgi:hypothetical protein
MLTPFPLQNLVELSRATTCVGRLLVRDKKKQYLFLSLVFPLEINLSFSFSFWASFYTSRQNGKQFRDFLSKLIARGLDCEKWKNLTIKERDPFLSKIEPGLIDSILNDLEEAEQGGETIQFPNLCSDGAFYNFHNVLHSHTVYQVAKKDQEKIVLVCPAFRKPLKPRHLTTFTSRMLGWELPRTKAQSLTFAIVIHLFIRLRMSRITHTQLFEHFQTCFMKCKERHEPMYLEVAVFFGTEGTRYDRIPYKQDRSEERSLEHTYDAHTASVAAPRLIGYVKTEVFVTRNNVRNEISEVSEVSEKTETAEIPMLEYVKDEEEEQWLHPPRTTWAHEPTYIDLSEFESREVVPNDYQRIVCSFHFKCNQERTGVAHCRENYDLYGFIQNLELMISPLHCVENGCDCELMHPNCTAEHQRWMCFQAHMQNMISPNPDHLLSSAEHLHTIEEESMKEFLQICNVPFDSVASVD